MDDQDIDQDLSDTEEANEQIPRRKLAKWQTFIPYQGRMTAQQRKRLDALRIKLSNESVQARVKDPRIKTDRITTNVFIRAGIDVILAIAPNISGHTEQQINDSIKEILNLKKRVDIPEASGQAEPESAQLDHDEPTWQN